MALSAERLVELQGWIEQYAAQAELLTSNMGATVWSAYQLIDDWSDTDQTLAAAVLAARVSQAGQQASAGLSAQYIAVVVALMADRPQSPIRPDLLRVLIGRRGTTGFKVWSRPVFLYREILRKGGTEQEAFQAARALADVLGHMDTALARREASHAQMETEQVTRYRRIIHPEVSLARGGEGTCGLCIAAATKVYNTGRLMPLHDRCACEVLPIIGEVDPGLALNDADLFRLLKTLYADADDSNKADDLKRTRYREVQHGELGPYLVRADGTTDPADSHRAVAA